MVRVAVIGGAGYTGGALIEQIVRHPNLTLSGVGSRSQAGKPVWSAHPKLRGVLDLCFQEHVEETLSGADGAFLAVNHGDGMHAVDEILSLGFQGPIIDLSADFRLPTAVEYRQWYGKEHVRPDLLDKVFYGMPEITGPPPGGTRLIANPGCFATAVSLALFPVAQYVPDAEFAVTALTGASGSGVHPGPATHFPTRDGNVRAYNVMRHRHQAEIRHMIGSEASVSFIPVSGPWTHGIWGTATAHVPAGTKQSDVAEWFSGAYGGWKLIRLYPEEIPELRHVVHTPFCDIGWILSAETLVIGFALDNLMKGAASQAVQNLNLLLGYPDWTGLIPGQDNPWFQSPQQTSETPT